jgi:hypothetical protein
MSVITLAPPTHADRAASVAVAWPRVAANVLLGVFASFLFAVLVETSGRIPIHQGMGWDGWHYVRMMTDGLDRGTANTQLRPLIILVNRLAFQIQTDAIAAFELMNVVYAGLLGITLAFILDSYAARLPAKVFFIATVAVSVATAQMFAFYPTLIDLGAYTTVAAATLFVLRGPGRWTTVMCLLAVLSREFGIAVVVFGVVRWLRLGVRPLQIAGVYAPAVLAFAALRLFVSYTNPVGAATDLVTTASLLDNLRLWRDPFFAGLFLYFLVTVFGGVSIILASRMRLCMRLLGREPEWFVFAGLVLAASAAGSADIWRYLAFLAPMTAVLFAQMEATWSGWSRVALFGLGGLLTWLTQRPFLRMDLSRYFSEWFPYYFALGEVPANVRVDIWPEWGWRLLAAAVALVVLSAWAQPAAERPGPDIS